MEGNNDGSLNSVLPDIKQLKGIPEEELVCPVKWMLGRIWLNMDNNSSPLKEWLGEYGEHLESYNFENWELIDYQTFEWNEIGSMQLMPLMKVIILQHFIQI